MSSSGANVASLAARAGGTVVRGVRTAVHPSANRPAEAGQPASGWLAVTVLCDPSEIRPGELPAPLEKLRQRIEVRVQPAPDGKGTELAARLGDGAASRTAFDRLSGNDPQADLRAALREAKQLIEVGEVLVVDPVPHGKRTPTPGGLLLEAWTKVAPKGGVR